MLKRYLVALLALAVCCVPISGVAQAPVYSERVDEAALPARSVGDTGLTADTGEGGDQDFSQEPDIPHEEAVEAKRVVLSASKLSIGVGERYTRLTAKLLPEGAANRITWSTANEKVVKVDKSTGTLTGVKQGTATVTATVDNGVKKNCKVTVKPAPTSLTLNATSVTLAVGKTFQLSATLPQGSASALTCVSSKAKVATVDESGLITAVKAGSATITVKTFNGKKAKCKVKVLPAPQQVFLPGTLKLMEGETRTVEASAADKRGKASVATYTYRQSAGTGTVRIDAHTGAVTGVRAGTAYVYVSTDDGLTTHLVRGKPVETVCEVTVEKGPAKVRLAAASVTVGVNQTYALEPVILDSDGEALEGADFTVESSNAKKLSVNAKGVIKGLAKGTYKVTVRAVNGVSASCAVKVVAAASKVTLSPRAPVIGQGQTVRLKATFPKGTMASCAFSSSDETVARVDGEGYVTGLKPGTCVVTAKTHNGKKDKVTVTVGRGPDFIELNAEYELVFDPMTSAYSVLYTKTLSKGKTFQLTPKNEYLTYGDIVAYESLDEAVATVSAKGLVKACAPGTATIVVRASSGAEARLRLTVPGTLPPSLAFVGDAPAIRAGQSVPAPGVTGQNLSAERLAAVKYSSGDKDVFTVAWDEEEAQWLLHGVKPGKATLTASVTGAKAQLEITVDAAEAISSIAFDSPMACMAVGETFAPAVADDQGEPVEAELFSEDPLVATVDEDGTVVAIGEGETVITAVYQDLKATMKVTVSPAEAQLALDSYALNLGVGQRHTLEVSVNGEKTLGNISFATSNSAVATVTRRGLIVARGVGSAEITVTATGGIQAVCTITVAPAPSALSLQPASLCGRLDEGGAQLTVSFGAPDEIGDVTFDSEDSRVAAVNEAGYVTFVSEGQTVVTARTREGLSASVDVTVLPERPVSDKVNYRLFAAYSYTDSSYSGYLYFPRHNARSVAEVLGQSAIGGQAYSAKILGNPSKTQLLSGISSYFSSNSDDDVSVIYLCSHGMMDSDYTHYRLLLPGSSENPGNVNYFVTAQEIMSCVSRVAGRVLLIIDSCYSGTFLQDMTGALDGQGGRIAVMTAASDTRASYYKVEDTNVSVDFFTYFLLQGLGYNERENGWLADGDGNRGSYPGYLAADIKASGNRDGAVSVGELFDYAARCIEVNIPRYIGEKWYWGDKAGRVQVPRYYAGSLDDLVIYSPK